MGLGAVSLVQVATLAPDASLRPLGNGREGLTSAEAARRLAHYGLGVRGRR